MSAVNVEQDDGAVSRFLQLTALLLFGSVAAVGSASGIGYWYGGREAALLFGVVSFALTIFFLFCGLIISFVKLAKSGGYG